MSYNKFKETNNKQYLGYCDEKGYVYSVQVEECLYRIVSIKNNELTVLIEYTTTKGDK